MSHLLLADHAVVDGLVEAVAVEPDGDVPLQRVHLHEGGLAQRAHHRRLHGAVQLHVRHADVPRHVPRQEHLQQRVTCVNFIKKTCLSLVF